MASCKALAPRGAKAKAAGTTRTPLLSDDGKAAANSGAPKCGDAGSAPERVLTPVSLACMAFLCVVGGPYGIEDAVGAAGAFPVLIACLVLPVLWGMPQALITAELSTMMDENGGYVLWVRRGMGNFWGWMSSYNSTGSNICDLPLYAVLLSQYLSAYVGRTFNYEFTTLDGWVVRAACLLFIMALNVRGVASVSLVSLLLTAAIVTPFVIEPVMPEVHVNVNAWASVQPNISWSVFVSTMLWNFQGWDGLGCVAGEVKDAARTYPLGVFIALVMAALSYAIPVMVGVCVVPDLSLWESGLLETIAAKISPWLGVWVVIGAMLSNVGEFNVVMCNSSRALWAMARRKMAPPLLARESSKYKTPVASLLFYFVTTAVLMSFGFEVLVVIDTFFNNVSLLLESISFLALRHNEPFAERPFRVPGGLVGAWAVTLPKFAIIFFGLGTAGQQAWIICGACNVVFALGYVFSTRYLVSSDDPCNTMDVVDSNSRASSPVSGSMSTSSTATGTRSAEDVDVARELMNDALRAAAPRAMVAEGSQTTPRLYGALDSNRSGIVGPDASIV